MSRLIFISLIAAAFATAALAQDAPAKVSPKQVADYQQNMLRGCKDEGKRQGDAAARVDAFCGCVMDTLRAKVPPQDWQKLAFHSMRGAGAEENKVLSPHLSSVQACRR